ncbi:hypothetical protein D3C73_1538800 [compost metagenome]
MDHAILYPVDSVCKSKGRETIIDDLIHRVSGKIFLVSFNDAPDCEWLSDIVERHVVYDVEGDL